MKLLDMMRVAWRNIGSNKLRTLLTMLGVIIGVAAVIIMIAISAGTEATIADQINSLGADLIFITPNMQTGGARFTGEGGLVYPDAQAIADQVSGVKGVSVEQSTNQAVKVGTKTAEGVTVLGTTVDFPSVRLSPVSVGRFFTETELEKKLLVTVLGYKVAQDFFANSDPVGEKVSVGTVKFTVIGVMAKRGLVGGVDFDSRIYVPITVIFDKFIVNRQQQTRGYDVRTIYVQAEDKDKITQVIEQIQLVLARRKGVTVSNLPVTVRTQQDIISAQESTTETFRTLLGWVAGVSLLVGGIGIMNIMLVSVTERTREIGIRVSIGATPNDVRGQFLTEAMILSLLGGVIGVLTGVGGSYLFGALGGMRTVVMPASIMLAFTSAAIVGIIFGFVPANRAANLDPIEALRHE